MGLCVSKNTPATSEKETEKEVHPSSATSVKSQPANSVKSQSVGIGKADVEVSRVQSSVQDGREAKDDEKARMEQEMAELKETLRQMRAQLEQMKLKEDIRMSISTVRAEELRDESKDGNEAADTPLHYHDDNPTPDQAQPLKDGPVSDGGEPKESKELTSHALPTVVEDGEDDPEALRTLEPPTSRKTTPEPVNKSEPRGSNSAPVDASDIALQEPSPSLLELAGLQPISKALSGVTLPSPRRGPQVSLPLTEAHVAEFTASEYTSSLRSSDKPRPMCSSNYNGHSFRRTLPMECEQPKEVARAPRPLAVPASGFAFQGTPLMGQDAWQTLTTEPSPITELQDLALDAATATDPRGFYQWKEHAARAAEFFHVHFRFTANYLKSLHASLTEVHGRMAADARQRGVTIREAYMIQSADLGEGERLWAVEMGVSLDQFVGKPGSKNAFYLLAFSGMDKLNEAMGRSAVPRNSHGPETQQRPASVSEPIKPEAAEGANQPPARGMASYRRQTVTAVPAVTLHAQSERISAHYYMPHHAQAPLKAPIATSARFIPVHAPGPYPSSRTSHDSSNGHSISRDARYREREVTSGAGNTDGRLMLGILRQIRVYCPGFETKRAFLNMIYRLPGTHTCQSVIFARRELCPLIYSGLRSEGGWHDSALAVLDKSLSAAKRASIIDKFNSGRLKVLISADELSRTFLNHIPLVINFDCPVDRSDGRVSPVADDMSRGTKGTQHWTVFEQYLHRVGRSSEFGRRSGVAISLWESDTENRSLDKIETYFGYPIPEVHFSDDAEIAQILGRARLSLA